MRLGNVVVVVDSVHAHVCIHVSVDDRSLASLVSLHGKLYHLL